MNSSLKGFILLVTSMVLMFGIAGGIEKMPADANYFYWGSLALAFIVAGISGLLGYSYINESNGQ